MAWKNKGTWNITKPETLIASRFTSRVVIKISQIADLKPTWKWAGAFYQCINIPVLGLARSDKKVDIPTTDLLLFNPSRFDSFYALKFIKADWIPSLTLTIYEDSMPINFEPAAPVVNVPSLFASVANSTTIPTSATSVSFLPANTSRKKMVIANNSNQDLYIDLDATASVADHAIKIPKVSASGFIASYELENYTGVVSGIWAAAGSGAALIREMVA